MDNVTYQHKILSFARLTLFVTILGVVFGAGSLSSGIIGNIFSYMALRAPVPSGDVQPSKPPTQEIAALQPVVLPSPLTGTPSPTLVNTPTTISAGRQGAAPQARRAQLAEEVLCYYIDPNTEDEVETSCYDDDSEEDACYCDDEDPV